MMHLLDEPDPSPDINATLLGVLLVSLILPTIGYLLVRAARPEPRPLKAHLAGWLCFWLGQLALPLAALSLGVLWLFGLDLYKNGYLLAAFVYGLAMPLLIFYGALTYLKLFGLGFLVLGSRIGAREPARASAGALLRASSLTLVVMLGIFPMVPMPGNPYGGFFYFLLVFQPMMLVSILGLALSFLLRRLW
jgi:hypothetical protein